MRPQGGVKPLGSNDHSLDFGLRSGGRLYLCFLSRNEKRHVGCEEPLRSVPQFSTPAQCAGRLDGSNERFSIYAIFDFRIHQHAPMHNALPWDREIPALSRSPKTDALDTRVMERGTADRSSLLTDIR